MKRTLIQSLAFSACAALAGTALAELLPVASAEAQSKPGASSPATGGMSLPVMAAEEPKRIAPSEVRGYRDKNPCDPRQGAGREACRAQLAAKYADMDKLCRIASTGSELPVCIRDAYAAE